VKLKSEKSTVSEYRETIAKTIREFREKKGYSRDDLSEIMDVDHSTISKIENGKFAISIDYLVKFSQYLDFEIALIKNET
jgi:transcriptional regulator with XRE-family HTH domain